MRFSLVLPSEMRMLGMARTFLEGVCQACGLDAANTYAVVLATGEAISNIICHAHQRQCHLPLSIVCQAGDNRLEIEIMDEGEPFDPCAIQWPDPTELRLGGRGIYLIRSLMDEVSCSPRQPRGNLLRLVKHLPTGKGQSGA